MYMKTKTKICAALLSIGTCIWSTQVFAQATTTTVTTTNGAFTEYVPGSQTVVVRNQANAAPLRYVVTKQTTVVDEAGTPIAIERIPAGSQLSVQYAGSGDRLVASRIIVQKQASASTTAPVTTTTTGGAAVTERETTTTTTRPLTHHEKHELKEAKEKEIERQKDALDEAKDKLDDDDD